MSGSLGFQPASELGPSPDERGEFAALIRSKGAELEELRKAKQSGAMKPAEKQALVQLLSDLATQNTALEGELRKQSGRIEDLLSELSETHQALIDVRTLAKDAIQEMKDEVASSKQLQETVLGQMAEDIAADKRRIKALEHPEKESETNQKRAEKIKEYLAQNGTPGKFLNKRTLKLIEGKAVRFELLRSYLDCDKWQLNRALRTLFEVYPGEYCKKKLNKTTWLLVERPKL